MSIDALVAAPLIVATVLAASAVGKLRSPQRAAQAFDALHVPRALARPWMRTAHPWGELALAVCLVVTAGAMAVGAALVAVALGVLYFVLVLGALQRPEPTDCACFGGVGDEPVSGWTVARNVWLLVLCGVCVWAALDGRSPVVRIADLGAGAWWLAALVAAAGMTALILFPRSATLAQAEVDDGEVGDGEYVRAPIPNAPVTLADGRVQSLQALAVGRPQLLLAVSGTCYSCLPTIEAAAAYRDRLPEVDVHLMYVTEAHEDSDGSRPPILHDPERYAYDALELRGTPSAVLLGADGMLAGGPVAGPDAIDEFVDDVEAELQDLRVLVDERS